MVNKYYQKQRERLQKEEALERYQNLSEEEKDKRREKVRDRYQNIVKEQKYKLLEFIKKYYLAHMKSLFGHFKDPWAIKFASWISP